MAKRILIVEDERPLSRALQLKLQHEGFTAKIASNGQQCMNLINAEDFDVILLDMMMPVMDGFSVLKELQGRPTHPTVFVLSNLSQREDEDRVLAAGAKKYFIKADTPLSVIIEEVKKA